MPNRTEAVLILKGEFPDAEVGLDNYRPYAKLPNGKCYGVLFRLNEYGQATEPEFIIQFTAGYISARNYTIHKVLAE